MGEVVRPKRLFEGAVIVDAEFGDFMVARLAEHSGRFAERCQGIEVNGLRNPALIPCRESFSASIDCLGDQVLSRPPRSLTCLGKRMSHSEEAFEGLGCLLDLCLPLFRDLIFTFVCFRDPVKFIGD